MTLANPQGEPAQAQLSVATRKDSSGTAARHGGSGWRRAILRRRRRFWAFLAALDAPISGRLVWVFRGGKVVVLEGELALGAGALQPSPKARPIGFGRRGWR